MHEPALAILTLLFALRVLGQALVVFSRLLAAWHRALVLRCDPLSYSSRHQLVMLPGMVKIAADIWRGRGFFAKPRPGCSRLLVGCSTMLIA